EQRTQPLPLSAARFLRTLGEAGFVDAPAMAQAAASLAHPHGSTRMRRAGQLGACALGLFLAAPPLARMPVYRYLSSTSLAHDGMLLQSAVAQLIAYDYWEQQSASPAIVQRRKALEIYLAGRLRPAIERAHTSGERLEQMGYVRLAAFR